MAKKITFIGGGSAKFVSGLVRDLFTFDELHDARICLMDISEERMDRSARLVRKMIAERKLPATVAATSDQRRAIEGADYVIVTIMVGGFKHYESDGAIPVKYGVLPTVGDTIGPGAVFRLIRTGPVVQQIARNVQEAAHGTHEVSANIVGVTEAASQTGKASQQALATASGLASEADALGNAVQSFLSSVRAA